MLSPGLGKSAWRVSDADISLDGSKRQRTRLFKRRFSLALSSRPRTGEAKLVIPRQGTRSSQAQIITISTEFKACTTVVELHSLWCA